VAIKSALNPGTIVKERPITVSAAQNFITGGAPLGESVLASAANKIIGFQRGAAGVAPKTPDFGSIISTLSSSVVSNVENRLQSINQNVTNIVNNKLSEVESNYRDRVSKADSDKPNNILRNFLSLYKDAIGYIQFLGNKRNVKTLGDNLQALQKIFGETFDVAKIIRQTIVKIVGQLSNLPSASGGGGGGLNLDIDIPGGPLKRTAPRGIAKLGKMALAGTAIAGAGALGTKVVSGMMDVGGGDVQPKQTGDASGGLSGPMLDRFNNILDRFSSAITNFKPLKQESASKKSSTAAPTPEKEKDASGGSGTVTATGSEQQKTEALIAGEEGVVLKAYQNPGDVPTIGYGQTRINGRAVQMGDVMTKEQATSGLRSNIESHRQVAIRNIGKDAWNNIKDENSKAVLTSLAYNYGHVPPSVVSAAKSGDPKKISDAVRGLTDPSNKSYDSRLIGRRNREADFIITGKSPKLDKDFLAGGKLATADGVKPSAVTTQPQKPPTVTAAPTQSTTAQQVSQTVAQQPGSNQPSKPLLVPINLAGQQQSPPSPPPPIPAPPVLNLQGNQIPNISSSNFDNFLTLYSKMTYNIVEG